MASKQAVILDFDGTVADSFPAAVEIAKKLLAEFGYPVPTNESLYAMRELSAAQLIKMIKISPRHLPGMLRFVRREQKKIIHKVAPIKGVGDALKKLSSGYQLAIVSTSDAVLIEEFLAKYKLGSYIHDVLGGAGLFSKHRQIKRYIKLHNKDPEGVLYVGDEVRDIDAARKANVPIISVGWGFNGETILKKNRPNVYISDPADLPKAVEKVLGG